MDAQEREIDPARSEPMPGKQIDDLVAAKLGWRKGKSYALLVPGNEDSNYWYNQEGYKTECRVDDAFANHHAWSPSTDWGAAGKLVEHIRETVSKSVFIDSFAAHDKWPDKWIVSIHDPAVYTKRLASGRASTAPHAICLAFLALPDEVVK